MVVEVEDHEAVGKVESDIKIRLSCSKVSVSSIIFVCPSIYFTM